MHPVVEDVEPFFALAATDYFANPWGQYIHGSHCFFVVVQAHVKGFDVSWIIQHHDRSSDMFLREIPLMFGLQIQSPLDGKLELLTALLENINGLLVFHAFKIVIDDGMHPVEDGVVYSLLKERNVVLSLLEDAGQHMGKETFRKVGIIAQVSEGDLRFDHPEFCEMS